MYERAPPGQYYQLLPGGSDIVSELLSVVEVFARLLFDAVPVDDLRPLYVGDMDQHWSACHHPPDEQLYRRLERENAHRGVPSEHGPRRPSAILALQEEILPADAAPYRRRLFSGSTCVAVQRDGVLICRSHREALRRLMQILGSKVPGLSVRGWNLYPAGGFREWHTNEQDTPGWRLYFPCLMREGASYFAVKTATLTEPIRVAEPIASINAFRLSATDLLWHTVYSHVPRISLGVTAPAAVVGRLLDEARFVNEVA